jgi:hypothetical protein
MMSDNEWKFTLGIPARLRYGFDGGFEWADEGV